LLKCYRKIITRISGPSYTIHKSALPLLL